jgi:hypothetical protein
MLQVPAIPYMEIEIVLAGAFVLLHFAVLLWRGVKAEIGHRVCPFCSKRVAADEYSHHLELCGLKKLWHARTHRRQSRSFDISIFRLPEWKKHDRFEE